MTLWSPPRISKSALAATRAAYSPLLNGLGNAARGAAARRAIHGLRAGRIEPAEVERALAQGQGGLLGLLAEHAALPSAPTIGRRAVDCVRGRRLLSLPTMEALLTWCRALLADGYLSVDELAAVNATQGESNLLRLVVSGWTRMVDAVVEGMGLPAPAAARCAYTMAPATVFRALEEVSGNSYGIDALFDEAKERDGIVAVTDAWPCVDLFANPATEPARYAALCEAWDAVAAKASLVIPSDGTDDYLGGMISELLQDLGRTATWEGDTPHFTQDALDGALEEVGWFDPDEFESVATTFLRHAKRARAARALDADTKQASVDGDAGLSALVARLKAVAEALPTRRQQTRRNRRTAFDLLYSSEGNEHFCALVSQHAGLASMYEAQLQEVSSESAVFIAVQDAQDPAQLLAVAKEGIMQVAAASAALSYVQEYNDAASPR